MIGRAIVIAPTNPRTSMYQRYGYCRAIFWPLAYSTRLVLAFALYAIAFCNIAISDTTPANKEVAIQFNNVPYFFRHSVPNLHQFTPKGQEDLNAWTDMLTLIEYKKTNTEESLARKAKAVLATYQQAGGKVLNAVSVPATDMQGAEHYIAVAFADSQFIEFVHFRATLSVNIGSPFGLGIMHSHRIYGKDVGEKMTKWMQNYGSTFEKKLLTPEIVTESEAALTVLK